MQQTRQTKQQPNSNLEISLLHSLNNLQVTEQSHTSACDTTPYRILTYLTYSGRQFFSSLQRSYRICLSHAEMCRRLCCTLCINGNHEKLLIKRRKLLGFEGTCIQWKHCYRFSVSDCRIGTGSAFKIMICLNLR